MHISDSHKRQIQFCRQLLRGGQSARTVLSEVVREGEIAAGNRQLREPLPELLRDLSARKPQRNGLGYQFAKVLPRQAIGTLDRTTARLGDELADLRVGVMGRG